MTETTLRRQLRKFKLEGGTCADRANFEIIRQIIIKLEDEIRDLRRQLKLARPDHYPDPTYVPPGPRLVHRNDDR